MTIASCLVGAGLMAAFAFLQPLGARHGFPLEWRLIAMGSVVGLGFYQVTGGAR